MVKKAVVERGVCAGVPSDLAARMKVQERENRELRATNEFLRKAFAYFARTDLDRSLKR